MKKSNDITCARCEKVLPLVRGSVLCFNCYMAKKDAENGIKPKRIIHHDEDSIQEAFFRAARIAFPKLGKLLYAVPNGGKRNEKEAKRFKAQGVVAGVADIVCLVPSKGHAGYYPFLCLETKTPSGSQSDEQKMFQQQVEQAGGLYVIFRSAGEGIDILGEYLKSTSFYSK